MGFFGNLFSGVKDVVSDIAPGIIGGLEVYNQVGQRRDRDRSADVLHDAIQADYDRQKQLYDYNMQYNQQANAASAAARASSAAARRANEAAALKAQKKALRIKNKGFEQSKDIYRPYLEAGQRLMPVMEGAYNQGIGGLRQLNQNVYQEDPMLSGYFKGR
jgi:regulator of protease activity HflC (stomatin/prohibitin superfamily)